MLIVVKQTNTSTFEVSVDGPTPTTHTVTVSPDYATQLTGNAIPTVELVERSFEFLLERESNTSILRSFELSVIQEYFPEYEKAFAASINH